MNDAQIAFVALTGTFLAAAVIETMWGDSRALAWACFVVAVFGFVMLAGMLFSDRRP